MRQEKKTMKKAYRTMEQTGAGSVALGIITIINGLATGILMIVNGGRLLKNKAELKK